MFEELLDFGPELISTGADFSAQDVLGGIDYADVSPQVVGDLVAARAADWQSSFLEGEWGATTTPGDFGGATDVIRTFAGYGNQLRALVAGTPGNLPRQTAPTLMQRLNRPLGRVGGFAITPLMLVGGAAVAYVATRR